MEAALASGDVDAVRRLLSGGTAAELRVAPAASSTLFQGRHWLRLPLADGLAIQLLHYRVMGKVVWPAAQALAEDLIEFWRAEPAMQKAEATFIEVAAGAGLPSLVASSAGSTFGRVVATDFTEEGVQLLAANNERNGSRLAATARLDLMDEGAAEVLVQLAPPIKGAYVVLGACDLAYNDAAVGGLFAAAATWLRRAPDVGPGPRLRVLFARSSNFEHTDADTRAAAAAYGFTLARCATRRGVPGVLDSSLGNTFVGCEDAEADVMTFVPLGEGAAASDSHSVDMNDSRTRLRDYEREPGRS